MDKLWEWDGKGKKQVSCEEKPSVNKLEEMEKSGWRPQKALQPQSHAPVQKLGLK